MSLTTAELEDVRTHARALLAIGEGLTREQFIAQVVAYAVNLGGTQAWMHGARTARYLWDTQSQ